MVIDFERSSNEPEHPTQNNTSGASPLACRSATTGTSIPCAQLKRSSGENAHGAPLFSIFENITARSGETFDSSITRFLRISTMKGTWSISTGHSWIHAMQVVQAHSSSSEIKVSLTSGLSTAAGVCPFVACPLVFPAIKSGPAILTRLRRSIKSLRGESFLPVLFAGHTSVHLPHSVQVYE